MKQRQSNIELLRIICMLFVLMIHFNLYSQQPLMINRFDAAVEEIGSLQLALKHFFHSFISIAVPCFVLISGWFGIDFKVKGLLRLYLQCLFCEIIAYLLYLLLSGANFRFDDFSGLFYFKEGRYWFLTSYIYLYVASPAINLVLSKLTRKAHFLVLSLSICALFVLWYIQKDGGLILFATIYTIGRSLHNTVKGDCISQKRWKWMCGYILFSLLTFGICILKIHGLGFNHLSPYNYANPLLLVAAVCFMMFFLSFDIKSGLVNKIAASVFAAYIIQENFFLGYSFLYDKLGHFSDIIPFYVSSLCIPLAAVMFLVISVIIDKICGFVYKPIIASYDLAYKHLTK